MNMGGLDKKTHLLILIAVALGLTAFLFFRPKFVVKDSEKSENGKPAQTQNNSKTETDEQEKHNEVHLSVKAKADLDKLASQLKKSPNDSQLFYQIGMLYASESVFDSAGHYFEKIAVKNPSVETWTNSGDAYFEAMSLALNPKNIEYLVSKTRDCYSNVLKLKENDLHAKTNLAMTYVDSDSPMQAISMLRSVLDADPNYEPAIMSLGGLSMRSNQYDKAVGRFRHVLKINPTNINAKLGLAYSLIELDQKVEAKKLLETVKNEKIDPILKDEITNALNKLK